MYVMASPGLALRDGISGWNPGCLRLGIVHPGAGHGPNLRRRFAVPADVQRKTQRYGEVRRGVQMFGEVRRGY